jgi:hypothetical protein
LFSRYSVDLVLQGHDHNYERTHVLRGEEVAEIDSRLDLGTAYVLCGNGGAVQDTFDPVQPSWSAFRQPGKIGTLKIDVDPFSPNGMRRVILSEYWALDGSAVEEGILLEKPASKQATTDPTDSPATGEPAITLPMADAPAGTAMVGVAASAGLALRNYTLEQAHDESRKNNGK